ncbi:MFS transporter [Cellulophaga sp. HaHa_2_1]|uniref:MFS transporter n=1 Tax=Cellulophaga sp. HaHa_2_1 TaxID=2749994 RepID=UPI001C4F856F|nr:MFS transporter [Cellulophaga sp. HaHa_2_1]QXP53794.1 MFS transporter [Cellulophaga sp. HaHa_2_1]
MKKISNKWILVSLSLSVLMASLGVSIANVALPTLTEAFEATFQSVQWVVISYLLTITIVIVSIGRLGDVFGLRRMLMFGAIIYTIASFFCGIAPTLWMLIFARAFQGLGAAILMALTLAFVRETVSENKIGSAMGLLGTMSAIGTALGPTLGGILIMSFGWRTIFLIMIPIGILNIYLIYGYLPVHNPSEKIKHKKVDWLGTLLIAITLASYTLAMTIGKGNFNWINLILLVIGLTGIGVFIYSQTKIESPLIQLSTFKNRTLSFSLIINSFVSTVMMATLVVGPFYLSLALGLNEAMVGIVMSIGPIVSSVTGIPSGYIVDRFGSNLVVIIGLIIMTLGAFALSILPNEYGVLGYIIAIAILTPGYQLFQAANNTSVMMDANKDQRGVISGVLNLSRNLGLITGASVMGALFAYAVGTSNFELAQVKDISIGMRTTFIIAGSLIATSVIISLTTRKSVK